MTVAKSTEFCHSVHMGLPATDPLAMGLLRLMAAYNDLIAVAEWSSEDKELTDDAADNTIRIGRRFLKWRLIASFFYEALQVMEQLEKESEFKKLEQRLTPEGKHGLSLLRSIRCGKDSKARDLLNRTRNLATFHYLEGPYKKALSNMKPNRGPNCVWPVLIRYKGEERRWYPLSEHLKIKTAFGLEEGTDLLIDRLNYITARLDDFATFLDEAFKAYKTIRKSSSLFALGTSRAKNKAP